MLMLRGAKPRPQQQKSWYLVSTRVAHVGSEMFFYCVHEQVSVFLAINLGTEVCNCGFLLCVEAGAISSIGLNAFEQNTCQRQVPTGRTVEVTLRRLAAVKVCSRRLYLLSRFYLFFALVGGVSALHPR